MENEHNQSGYPASDDANGSLPESLDAAVDIRKKATPTDEQLIRRGHLMYWVVASINLVLVVLGMTATEPQATQSFGTILNLGLLYLIYQGNNIARWIMVSIFSLLSTVLILVSSVQLNTLGLAIGVTFLVVPLLLMTASVTAWLRQQRAAWRTKVVERIRKQHANREKKQ